ncbi:MAG: hypothetical protein VR70_13790 [Rhodospirillaceae bacterium BRH_c57]|nr:MAG: hypothetical protein VR70_13790 [Rhodospirillaceae bacterium BRH_c57]
MAFTQSQLDALENAIASGQLTVTYDGKSITYRNMGELLRAHDIIKRSLSKAGTSAVSTPVFDRGV